MPSVGNWVGEFTSTVGIGTVSLDGPVQGHVPFSTISDATVWYAIIDGDNREAGIGTKTATTLQRTTVKATYFNGVYTDSTPSAMPLSGSAQVFCTFNKSAFDDFLTQAEGDSAYATVAQGALADSATQPGDNISDLTNDANYVSSGDNVSDLANDANYVSAGDNVSDLTNDAGYLSSVPAASETVAGISELATQAEAEVGVDDERAMTPLKVAQSIAANAVGGISFTRKTANYTSVAGEGVIADTTGGTFTVTLPITPVEGDQVVISDGGDWASTNLTVGRNGETIEGLAEDLVMDLAGVSASLIFDGNTWQVYGQAAQSVTSALNPGDNVSELANDAGYLVSDGLGLAGNYDIILSVGVYTSGTYSIPNGRTWDDYDIVEASSSATVNTIGPNARINAESMLSRPDSWILRVVSQANQFTTVTAISATQFTVSRVDDDFISGIIGYRKAGVA